MVSILKNQIDVLLSFYKINLLNNISTLKESKLKSYLYYELKEEEYLEANLEQKGNDSHDGGNYSCRKNQTLEEKHERKSEKMLRRKGGGYSCHTLLHS